MVTIGLCLDGNTTMSSTPEVWQSDARADSAPTLLLIHGYLDSATVWNDLVDALGDCVNVVRYDLPGFGTRHIQPVDLHEISLPTLAVEAASIAASIQTPVYLVGHSLGTQVAQLVAAEHPELVAGLILMTPVPLAGTHLPEESVAQFRALAAHYAQQRQARAQLSPALTDRQLDRLTHIGTLARPSIGARYADVWNDGFDSAASVEAYRGPVLIVGGGADGFVTQPIVDTVAGKFIGPQVRTVENGGHWLHVEHPGSVATVILDFLDDVTVDVDGLEPSGPFGDRFTDDIVLEGAVFAKRVVGKTQVQATLSAAGSIYGSLQFTTEAHNSTTTYLQWTARRLDSTEVRGISVVRRNASGAVTAISLHHQPLAAVLEFSTALRDRLANVVDPEHFMPGSDQCVPPTKEAS
jgi:pimeloyl-ACP methyl ester carboxylesterase